MVALGVIIAHILRLMEPHEIVITVSGILLALGTLITTIVTLQIKKNSEYSKERIKEMEAKTELQIKLLKLTNLHSANASSHAYKAIGKISESMTDRRKQLGRIEEAQAELGHKADKALEVNNEAISASREAIDKSNHLSDKIKTVALENNEELKNLKESIKSQPINPQ